MRVVIVAEDCTATEGRGQKAVVDGVINAMIAMRAATIKIRGDMVVDIQSIDVQLQVFQENKGERVQADLCWIRRQ